MLNKTRQFWRVFFRRFLCNHNFISRETGDAANLLI